MVVESETLPHLSVRVLCMIQYHTVYAHCTRSAQRAASRLVCTNIVPWTGHFVTRSSRPRTSILEALLAFASTVLCIPTGTSEKKCFRVSRLCAVSSATACLGRRRPVSRSRDDWSQWPQLSADHPSPQARRGEMARAPYWGSVCLADDCEQRLNNKIPLQGMCSADRSRHRDGRRQARPQWQGTAVGAHGRTR
jgi:hypothetical protein